MSDFNDRTGPNQPTLAALPDPELLVVDSSSQRAIAAAVSSASRIDPYIGKTLDGRYFVEQLLGEGGMGVVYRGRHKVIDKRVAIKILRGDMAADAEMVERFLNEARAASSIGNPHIVDISDFGRLDDGATYFVMEFLDGQSLGDVMAGGGVIPIPRLVHIAKQIARGLAAAHQRGIVHRDLKPDNVMLVVRGEDRDFAKVLDFGIAKVSSEAGKLTRAGSVFGTPHYMSPEQAAGVPVDHRTDIYSLGVILYEMASGKVPFDADNFMGILTQHMYKSPAPIRALVPQPQEVPPGLEAIVLKCLSKKVELRYQSMEEVAADLERAERGVVPEAVQEMMGRSGGFNVPADYFRKIEHPGGAAMLPATPTMRQKKPVLAAVLFSLAAVVLVVVGAVVIIGSVSASPKPGDNPITSASSDLPVAPQPTAVAALTPGAGAAAGQVTFYVKAEPEPALVGLDKGELKEGTFLLNLAPTASASVRVEKKGYITRTVTIEGKDFDPKDPIRVIKLEKEKPAALAGPPPVRPGKTPPVKPLPASTAPTSTAVAPTKAPPVPTSCGIGEQVIMGKCTKL